jgi:hypothetical protein
LRLPIYFKLFTGSCSCLAHVINLATQALIATYSKSPHFDPKNPEAHIPTSRDEVGLVRAIVVKVQNNTLYWRMVYCHSQSTVQERSSSKRKQIWRTVQTKNKLKPLQLILDMKVRWSSTYFMLDRAERKKEVSTSYYIVLSLRAHNILQCVNDFLDELYWDEKDYAKRYKIRELKLTDEEWARVSAFLGLLSVRHQYCYCVINSNILSAR